MQERLLCPRGSGPGRRRRRGLGRGRPAVVGVMALALSGLHVMRAEGSFQLTTMRTIGQSGHAELYGWGAATMTDGSVLISDYWNFRIQHYNQDGTLRRTAVPRNGRHQAPYDVAVDPRDDSIYFGDVDGGRRVEKYDRNGRYLYSLGGPGLFIYPAWLAVDGQGRVAVADSRDHKIVVFDDQGRQLLRFGSAGSGPGQFHTPRGVGFDAAGRLYVADTNNDRIQVFTLDPNGATFQRQWPVTGDFRGLTVDSGRGVVYLVNAGRGQVQRFTLTGEPLAPFGGINGRGVTVAGDGTVWVGDMPNFRAVRFTPDGGRLADVPTPAAPPPPGGFNQPAGAAVDASGNVYVTDTFNFRIQKLAPDGAFIGEWGFRGGGTTEFGLNYARGIAVDRRDGSVIVGNTDAIDIRKYTSDGEFVWTTPKGPKVYALDVAPDGRIYAADSAGGVVRVYSPDGAQVATFGAGRLVRPRGISVDPDGSVWVSSHGQGTVSRFSAAGAFLGEFGSAGSGDHQFLEVWDVESDANHVYVADMQAHKVKVFTKTGAFVGAFGGGGRTPGRMLAPQGMHLTPEGHLYVAEKSGERIQVFATSGGSTGDGSAGGSTGDGSTGDGSTGDGSTGGGSGPDTTPPAGAVTAPPAGAVVNSRPVAMAGTATDDVAVAGVRLGIQNRATGLWWRADGTWGAYQGHEAVLGNPGAPSTSWTFSWEAPPGEGSYGLSAIAHDAAGNVQPVPRPWVTFSVSSGSGADPGDAGAGPDTTPPRGFVTAPTHDAVLPPGPAVMTGTATDDTAVAGVRIGIQDRATGRWWRPDGTWGAFAFHPATLDAPGATATGWTFTWTPPGAGSYGMAVIAVDTAGNAEPIPRPWVAFGVSG